MKLQRKSGKSIIKFTLEQDLLVLLVVLGKTIKGVVFTLQR